MFQIHPDRCKFSVIIWLSTSDFWSRLPTFTPGFYKCFTERLFKDGVDFRFFAKSSIVYGTKCSSKNI